MNLAFWRNKKVLITGHTGFKGSWLSLWLQQLEAQVIGFFFPPPQNPIYLLWLMSTKTWFLFLEMFVIMIR